MGHSWGGFDTTLSRHSHQHLRRSRRGRAHHRSSQQLWQSSLEFRHRRDRSYRNRPAAHGSAAVGGSASLHPELRRIQRAEYDHAFLIEVGDSDGTVFFHQGVELYNFARRAKKEVVMIVYAGEDHGLRKKPDQIDYQRRIFAWFGHYLKANQPRPGSPMARATWTASGK